MDHSEIKPLVILIIGGPGSGKGNLCKGICDKFSNFVHLSIGDILREFKYDTQSDKGKIITSLFEEYNVGGVYPPFEIPSEIMLDHLKSNYNKVCLIDGFHKTMDMVQCWENIVALNVNLKLVVVLDCSIDVMRGRLLNREKGIVNFMQPETHS